MDHQVKHIRLASLLDYYVNLCRREKETIRGQQARVREEVERSRYVESHVPLVDSIHVNCQTLQFPSRPSKVPTSSIIHNLHN